ncbi:hypothetical protein [Pseudoruegeria sp. HB172150]|uniref:hypothetical protein n=1 Tax=Pseudoruegeria sp. HB172150 TaxID=2721164 RepID=UPI001552DB8F|nr:hypothetical protein [Pseudoruegeria sp. HB172150]
MKSPDQRAIQEFEDKAAYVAMNIESHPKFSVKQSRLMNLMMGAELPASSPESDALEAALFLLEQVHPAEDYPALALRR